MDLKSKIRVIENFPKEGISFKDITTLLQDGEALKYSTSALRYLSKSNNKETAVIPSTS